MKTHRLKNFLELGLMLFGVPFVFYTCQEPNISEQYPVTENNNISYRIISLDEAPGVKNIIENIQPQIEDTNSLYRQTSTVYGVAKVDIEEIIAITKYGVTNYTFGIDTDFKNSGYIENLQLIAVEEGYIAYIMRYEPEEGWKDDDFNKTPKGELVLDINNFNGHKTKYTLDGQIIWTTNPIYDAPAYRTECHLVTTKNCHNDGGGGYSDEAHVAGSGCTGYNGEFDYGSQWVCEEVSYFMLEVGEGGGGGIDYNNLPGGGGGGDPQEGSNDPHNPLEDGDCFIVEGSLIINQEVISGIGVGRGCATNADSAVKQMKEDKNCVNLKNLSKTDEFSANINPLVTQLRTQTEMDNEHYINFRKTFIGGEESNIPDSNGIQAGAVKNQSIVKIGTVWFGQIHTHPMGTHPMFNFRDVNRLRDIHVGLHDDFNKKDVFIMIVNHDGTVYALKIDSIFLLANALDNELQNTIGATEAEKGELLNKKIQIKFSEDADNDFERVFLKKFNGYGISIYKATNQNLSNWNKLELENPNTDDTTVKETPCN